MICPKCHKDNPTINLHCDFCSEELPLSKERKEIVLKHKKVLRQDKWQKTKDTLVGMLIAITIIIIIIVGKALGWF
ncbi:MAG: hypothetical protein ACOX40_02805 [Bacilli bacterium]|jgi:uncharacterized membrane protein YvbJ|nr:hypothetical protein [Acholeplasmataceae bacterium]